jgi:hypothetical protein
MWLRPFLSFVATSLKSAGAIWNCRRAFIIVHTQRRSRVVATACVLELDPIRGRWTPVLTLWQRKAIQSRWRSVYEWSSFKVTDCGKWRKNPCLALPVVAVDIEVGPGGGFFGFGCDTGSRVERFTPSGGLWWSCLRTVCLCVCFAKFFFSLQSDVQDVHGWFAF